jgi:quercetin dioxygenase-like cupin family protein
VIDLLLSVALVIGDAESVARHPAATSALHTTTVVATQTTRVVPPQRTTMLDNATVTVTRLRFAAGAGEAVHTHDFPVVIVQLTAGEVDLTVSDARAIGPRVAGSVTYVPAGTEHAAKNAGAMTFELLAIAIKPTRPPALEAPPTEAPAGITRTTILDNADVRSVRVQLAPGSRERVHSHPNDLVTVQLTTGKVRILVDGKRTDARLQVGSVQFLPRNTSHAYENSDHNKLEMLSIFIK